MSDKKYSVYYNGRLHTKCMTLGKAVRIALKLWPSYITDINNNVIWTGEK